MEPASGSRTALRSSPILPEVNKRVALSLTNTISLGMTSPVWQSFCLDIPGLAQGKQAWCLSAGSDSHDGRFNALVTRL